MKIISKYKDYYDYLSGIYGEDPKLILDRRNYDTVPYRPPNKSKMTFYIAGKVIEGYYLDNKVYYGESLKQFEYRKNLYYPSIHHRSTEEEVYIEAENGYRGNWFSPIMYDDPKKYNDNENCPILMASYYFVYKFFRYPILKDWNLSSFISPEEMFKMLSDWLSQKISQNEIHEDLRTDILKLESKGFNKKESFRNIK